MEEYNLIDGFLKTKQTFTMNKKTNLSSYELELQNRVTQNNITLRVTNSKIFIKILLSSY